MTSKTAAPASAATLREIHSLLTRATLKRLREAKEPPKVIDGVLTNPPLKASEFAVMVKFLKDNGIVADASYDSEQARRAAVDEKDLPFPANNDGTGDFRGE
jgi:hypothetical protein